MIGVGRKQRVSVQRSIFTDELMIYLSRIADAVERQADRPTLPQIADMIDRRIAEHQRNAAAAGASVGPKSRAMPLSMFGREYPEKGWCVETRSLEGEARCGLARFFFLGESYQ
jgi:hypothetical protein